MPQTDRLPRALYRAAQVVALERLAIERHGITGTELMERAGAAAFALIQRHWPAAQRLLVLAGAGNNGGDGYVVARLALAAGRSVRLLQLGDHDRLRGEAAAAAAAFAAAGGRAEPYVNGLALGGGAGGWTGEQTGARAGQGADVIVDALLGTGLERPVTGAFADAIAAANRARVPVLAIDLPSGLHADTGRVLGCALRADATISFIGLKQGLFTGRGPALTGAIHFDALALPAVVYAAEIASARRLDWPKAAELLTPRPRDAHKGDCGHVLVVGGAPGMSGAGRLCAEAALRSGAGLVTLATHPEHAALVNLTRPELMVRAVIDGAELDTIAARADVIAIGPGLGRDAWGRGLLARVLDLDKPLVVDADGLNLLAELGRVPPAGSGPESGSGSGSGPDPDSAPAAAPGAAPTNHASPERREHWILTPHPGEAARLLDTDIDAVEADRFAAVTALQQRYGGAVVLKGAGSLIRGGGNRPTAVCDQGNPGMASGGMGDVLTGIIAGLWAAGQRQGVALGAEEAASVGVCLHAAAGDAAAAGGERGLIATDLIDQLRGLLAAVDGPGR